MSDLIVVIDDDPVNNLICEKVILDKRFANEVMCFLNAEDALKHLCGLGPEERPEMVLLDINLLGLSGWDFLDHLNLCLPGHKFQIYMLSSSASLSDQLKAEAHPEIAGFVMKPLTKVKLEQLLNAKNDASFLVLGQE